MLLLCLFSLVLGASGGGPAAYVTASCYCGFPPTSFLYSYDGVTWKQTGGTMFDLGASGIA
jgi:hypothetical protein